MLLVFRPQGQRAVLGPEDVVQSRRLRAIFAEPCEALAPVVLAMHHNLRKPFGESRLCLQEGQYESSRQLAFREAMDECQLFLVRSLKMLYQLIERCARLRLFHLIEGLVEKARQEKSLHEDDVVKSLQQPLVSNRFRMRLDSREDGCVGPSLVTEKRLEESNHTGIIAKAPRPQLFACHSFLGHPACANLT